MRLNTGRTSSERRNVFTSSSVLFARTESRASEKPIAFSVRMPNALPGRPFSLTLASISTMPRISERNHGSILQEVKISSSLQPSRIACATCSRRSGVGVPKAARTAFLSSPRPRSSISISSRPVRPVSRPRSAFCRLSWKVRPIAITSPTDFIEVVSVRLAPGNFSKLKRGILTTT